jgi:hypothetical protein
MVEAFRSAVEVGLILRSILVSPVLECSWKSTPISAKIVRICVIDFRGNRLHSYNSQNAQMDAKFIFSSAAFPFSTTLRIFLFISAPIFRTKPILRQQ